MAEKSYVRVEMTEEELLGHLLRRAIGSPMPTNHQIIERNIYGETADPWCVFRDVDDSHWDISEGKGKNKQVKSTIHVITKVTKIKSRISRRAGCGSWSGQTSGKKILNGSGQLIGSKKLFNFEKRLDETVEDDGHDWIMSEYSLAGTYMSNYRVKHDDYVICRITRKSKLKEKYRRRRKHVSENIDCSSANDRNNDEVARMLADSSVNSPGSAGFGELTQEDLEILNSILIWT
ncbi:hypothetical protein CASFOL_024712 [Castilleja foliolosa]|uniref:NAC domain-containing protein n=1 Tax=Castilleja foliolosa TaxID=1961234 RepID=A0ABD3CQ14_9LAMI